MNKFKKFRANRSNVMWDQNNRSVTDDDEAAEAKAGVTDDEAAEALAAGHPKSTPPSIKQNANVMPGSPGSGAAPGASGPPTTGSIGPGGSLGSY
jgi:hypothetical protein